MVELLGAVGAGVLILAALGWLDERVRAAGRPGFRERFRQVTIGQVMIAIALIAVVLSFAGTTNGSWLAIAGLALLPALFVRAWIREFVDLMARPDDAFPGRHDKLVWAAALLLMAPIGVWMYRAFRHAAWPEPAAAGAEAAETEPGLELA